MYFYKSEETGDYKLTKNLLEMLENKCQKEEIITYLRETNMPLDEKMLKLIVDEIINNPPKQGYLTISNVFQWRIRYNHVEKGSVTN